MAWLALLFSLGQRFYHWVGLVIILALILFVGLGAPLIMPTSTILGHWGHW